MSIPPIEHVGPFRAPKGADTIPCGQLVFCKQCEAVMQLALLRGVTGSAEARLAEGWDGGSESRTLGWAAGGRKLACTRSLGPAGGVSGVLRRLQKSITPWGSGPADLSVERSYI